MIYIESGLDFDNNKFGLGWSVEIERDDGTEIRCRKVVRLKNKRYYFRCWILKKVFVFFQNGFEIKSKKCYNLKIVFGIAGEK